MGLFGRKKREPETSGDIFSELEQYKQDIGGTDLFGNQNAKNMNDLFGQNQQLLPPINQQGQQQQLLQFSQPSQQTQQLLPPPPPPFPQIEQPKIEKTVEKEVEKETMEEKGKEEKTERNEIYVKLEDYKRLLEILEKIKLKLKEIESYVNELREMKEKEVSKMDEIKDRIDNSKEDISGILDILK